MDKAGCLFQLMIGIAFVQCTDLCSFFPSFLSLWIGTANLSLVCNVLYVVLVWIKVKLSNANIKDFSLFTALIISTAIQVFENPAKLFLNYLS